MLSKASLDLHQRKLEIAHRIRQARRDFGWTQEQTANFLGCSRKRYNSVERGIAELNLTEVDLLAKTWQIAVDYFFQS